MVPDGNMDDSRTGKTPVGTDDKLAATSVRTGTEAGDNSTADTRVKTRAKHEIGVVNR